MLARWMTLGIWALVAAAAVAWGLRLFVKPAPVPAGTTVADASPPLQADLTRLLGADPPPPVVAPEAAPPPPDTRFALLGVVAPRQAGVREGVALIAVDDRPPRAFRVGARVDGETVLQRVSARGADLGPRGGPVRVSLQLPALEPPATGTLPGVAGAAPAPPTPVPPFGRPGQPRPPMQGQPMPQPLPVERDPLPEPAQQPRGNAPTLM